MNFFGHDLLFWVAAVGATILKILLSPWAGFLRAAISVASALFLAVVFTEALVSYLSLNPDTYRTPVAALVALTGEGLTRWLLQLVDDPKKLVSLFKVWRGGGGK
jgi:hypothetical protein